jgi:hypothetical protein
MNALIYIGTGLMVTGFVLFIVATIMERHYDRKLYKLHNGGDKHDN